MPIQHLLLALLVVVVWGLNFLFVKLSLDEISPLLLCSARFILASIPAIFFIKPPPSIKTAALYGLIMFGLQFSLIFTGMHAGMTPGMASLVLQVQVFFSMFFAAIILREKPYSWQVLGALVSFIGVGMVAMHCDDKNVSGLGLTLLLAAAATWGIGNLITKKANDINMMALVVWGSFFASVPILVVSLVIEGPKSLSSAYHHLSGTGALSVLYTAYISTWVGYGVWNWLLVRYRVSALVPFTLLVPIVGVMSSVVVLHERFQSWKLFAGLLVISGLMINLFGARLVAGFRKAIIA